MIRICNWCWHNANDSVVDEVRGDAVDFACLPLRCIVRVELTECVVAQRGIDLHNADDSF